MAAKSIAKTKKAAPPKHREIPAPVTERVGERCDVALSADSALTPEAASKIAGVLGDVMNELRALVDASQQFEGLESDTLPILAEAICKRAHVRLDRCAILLGAVEAGSFIADDD
jgi:hypothetical protein